MTTVKRWVIGTNSIKSVNIGPAIRCPCVKSLFFIFQPKVETVGLTPFNNEIFFQEIRLIGELLRIVVNLVSVDVCELIEIFDISFKIKL